MSDAGRKLSSAARTVAHEGVDISTESLAERAAAANVLDVAYAEVDSPMGPLLIAVTPRGLARIGYLAVQSQDDVLEELAAKVSPRILKAPGRLDEVRRELEEYFAGDRSKFDVRLDWRLARGGFSRRILEATVRIPYGDTSTYTVVATRAGSPRAYRAAGSALGANPIPIVVPCHRVLHASGGLGGYGGGLEIKRLLLDLERGA